MAEKNHDPGGGKTTGSRVVVVGGGMWGNLKLYGSALQDLAYNEHRKLYVGQDRYYLVTTCKHFE